VLDDHWIGSFRLRCVPGVFGGIKGRKCFLLIDERLSLGVPWLGGEQSQRGQADIGLQRFPGLIAYRACITSWTMLLLFKGESPISSDAAASTIQKAG